MGMEKVKRFDEELRNTYKDAFFLGRFVSYMFFGLGLLLMLIPFEPSDGIRMYMFQGLLMSTIGVKQYLQGYLYVKEGDHMVSIYKKLSYMPVTKAEIQKVRRGYLNRICVKVGSGMFVIQETMSLVNHSFGMASVMFVVCGIVLMWGFGWMYIYMSK